MPPYLKPTTIDGQPRRPLVERVPECRPTITFPQGHSIAMDEDGHWRHADGGGYQSHYQRHPAEADAMCEQAINRWARRMNARDRCRCVLYADTPEERNEAAHRLADEVGVER